MKRESVTTGLIAEASRVLHETVGVLSKLKRGAAMRAVGTANRRVASCRTRAASLRSEFLIVPLGFIGETNSAMMSGGQG